MLMKIDFSFYLSLQNLPHYIRSEQHNRRIKKEAITIEIYRFYLNGQFTISNFSKELITHGLRIKEIELYL